MPTPLDPVTVVGTETGLCALAFSQADAFHRARRRSALSPLPFAAKATPPHVDTLVDNTRDALAQYFAGVLQALDTLPIDVVGTPFQLQVWQALRKIPCGQSTTYSGLALALGRRGAERAVGAANGSNPVAIVVPCHRVVGKSGALTGYAFGVARKRALLVHEGVLLA